MNDGVRELSADAVIHVGGWHPSYARVLVIEHDDRVALILIDGNGDGAELELEYWHCDQHGLWHGGSTSGYGPLASLPALQTWNADRFVAAVGRTRPGADVIVEYDGQRYKRRAGEYGTWGFVHAADSSRPDELPALADSSSPFA